MRTNTTIPLMKRPLMRSKTVCAYLGDLSERTLDEWAYKRTGPPFIKPGKHRLYDPDDLDAWVERQKSKSVGHAA